MTEHDGSQPLKKPQWEKFAQLVAGGMGYEDAYAKVGFKRDHANAKRLSEKPDVRTRIDWLQTQAAASIVESSQAAIEASGLTRDWVITRLMENVERSMQAVPVVIAGVPTGEYEYDGSVANRALEILGKVVVIEGAMAAKERQDEQGHVAKSIEDPQVVTDILNVQKARKLMLAGGKDVEAREKKPA